MTSAESRPMPGIVCRLITPGKGLYLSSRESIFLVSASRDSMTARYDRILLSSRTKGEERFVCWI